MSHLPPIAVTFARPEESRAFRRRLLKRRSERLAGLLLTTGRLGTAEVVVLHTGIGPKVAEESIRTLLAARVFCMVLGAGFAGALDPALVAGDVVLDEREPVAATPPRVVSRALPVESVAGKAALFAETAAQAVDMETESLAAVCLAASVPFLAVRAISDTAAEPLPVPFAVWFDATRQRARPLALLAWLARHPSRVWPFARFVRRISKVGEALALSLEGIIRGVGDH